VTTTIKSFKNQTLRSEILEICKIRSNIKNNQVGPKVFLPGRNKINQSFVVRHCIFRQKLNLLTQFYL